MNALEAENSLAAIPEFPSASLFSLEALDLHYARPDFGYIHRYEACCEQLESFRPVRLRSRMKDSN
jgi:hypothetical protein